MTEVRALPTRIPVGRQVLPLKVIFGLIFLAELAFAFLVFAALRPHQVLWWILLSVVAILVWSLWKYTHRDQDWDRTPHLELHDGRIAFVPSRRMRQMGYATTESSFPKGSGVEYRIETGDHYFAGDHGQRLRSSLWIVGPTGAKQELLNFAVEVIGKHIAANLANSGIPFRAVKIYDGERGEHTETDVTALYTQDSRATASPSFIHRILSEAGFSRS